LASSFGLGCRIAIHSQQFCPMHCPPDINWVLLPQSLRQDLQAPRGTIPLNKASVSRMPTAMQRPWASEAPSNREIESRPHLTCLRLSAPSLFLSLSAANAGSITSFQSFHQGSQMPHRFQDLRGRLLRVSSVLGVFAFNGLHLKGAIQGPLLRQADRCLAAFRDCRARPFPSKDRSEFGTRSLGHVPRPSAFFGNTEMQTPVRLLDARSFQTPAGRLRCLAPIRISVEV
jgi:hypothetical protein